MFSCQHCAHCATACLCCQESTRMWATGAGKRGTLSHSVFQQGHVGQWHLWVWGPSGQEVPSQAKWAGLVSPSTQPAWTPSAAAWGQPPRGQCTQKRLMLLFTPTRPPLPVPQMMSPPLPFHSPALQGDFPDHRAHEMLLLPTLLPKRHLWDLPW